MIDILFLLCGGMAALMAHRGLMIFHDASRSLANSVIQEGQLSRREWFLAAYPLSIGLAVGVGIPFSLVSTIALAHLLFLGTDLIGSIVTSGRNYEQTNKISWLATGFAAVIGFTYAAVLHFSLGFLVEWLTKLPVPIDDAVIPLAEPVVTWFFLFPALVIYLQFGSRPGIFSFIIIISVKLILRMLPITEVWPKEWIVLFVGMGLLLAFIFHNKNETNGESIVPIFQHKAHRLRSAIFGIFLMGALYGATVHTYLLAEGPQSLLAMQASEDGAAAAIAFSRAVSFLPLKGMTSLTTGTFPTDGFGFSAVAGLLADSLLIAFVLGGFVMVLEVMILIRLTTFLDHVPALRDTAEHIRTAMSRLLEIGLLIGAFMACFNIAGSWGCVILAGLYLLNEYGGKRLPRISVGLIGFLLVYTIVNIILST